MDTHRKHAPKGACFLMCILRQDRQRGKHEVRWRGAAIYGVLVIDVYPPSGFSKIRVGGA